jgi:hypothetical protein
MGFVRSRRTCEAEAAVMMLAGFAGLGSAGYRRTVGQRLKASGF